MKLKTKIMMFSIGVGAALPATCLTSSIVTKTNENKSNINKNLNSENKKVLVNYQSEDNKMIEELRAINENTRIIAQAQNWKYKYNKIGLIAGIVIGALILISFLIYRIRNR